MLVSSSGAIMRDWYPVMRNVHFLSTQSHNAQLKNDFHNTTFGQGTV